MASLGHIDHWISLGLLDSSWIADRLDGWMALG